jgi:uncharacterized protein (DUF697 family)
MVVRLQKPILVGAISLGFTVWLLELLSHWLIQPAKAGAVGLLGIGVVTVGFNLWLRQKQSAALEVQPEAASAEAVKQVLVQTEQIIEQLAGETADSTASQNQLRSQLTQVTASLERGEIHLAVTGGRAVGKTSLIQALESDWAPQLQWPCSLTETFSLFTSDEAGLAQEEVARQAALSSDLVLFLSQGDLTQLEYQTLSDLVIQKQRTVLVFNKQDQYLPTQQSTILQQLRSRLRGKIAESDIVAIAAHPGSIKVRRHQADGSVQEWMEQPQPQVKSLTERLNQVLTQEAEQLVLQTTMHQALALKIEAQAVLNQARRDRALPLIEQFQWVAAATAFASPLPSLDLLAAAAISSKMVLDLGKLYQQKFSLAQAQAIAGTLASLMLKLGLVEFSTQTLGSLLKSNSVTYVAGGAVQGVSAAYLTRLAGLSLIEHFQTLSENHGTSTTNSKLAEVLQTVFQQNQRIAFLKSLIQQTLDRFRSPSGQTQQGLSQPLQLPSSDLEPLKISEPLKIPEFQAESEFIPTTSPPVPETV